MALLTASPIDATRWTHHKSVIRSEVDPYEASTDNGIHIHYVSCLPPEHVQKKGVVLLIHGFPETWYQFRRVITPISDAGYHVIVPDYRGAGQSSKPPLYSAGFTKSLMAEDLHILLTKHLGITDKVHVVGHDIGGMVAHAFATQFPESTASVCWGECPLPGSSLYEGVKTSPVLWHFLFFSIPDVPEFLIAGKVREFLKYWYDRVCQNAGHISNEDLDVYEMSYSATGAMRCALNVYRAFARDAAENNKWVQEKGKSGVRCLTLWGDSSFADTDAALGMCHEYYKNAELGTIKDCGHWIAEEQPERFVEKVLEWVSRE